ncbi:MAG: tetratricopeptide repeat protein [Candidatus Hydrogenedentes bacterium]|nr:tetratricopeptide repeat protein [Candidatus Hydrogenedentota bacterium]
MIAVLLTTIALGAGGAYDTVYARGNSAYAAGDYAGAIAAYEQLVAEDVAQAPVFHALGNAYYRAGNLGAAIANYERALHVAPTYADARHNLDFCVGKTERQWGRPLPPAWQESLLMWHDTWSPRAVYRLAVICWAALWAVLVLRLWKPDKLLTRAAIALALAAAAFATSAYAKFHPPLLAVAVQDHAAVRFGLGEGQTTNFELLQGDRVVIDSRRDGWALVRNADGDRGWVEESALAFVGPPYLRPGASSESNVAQGAG